MLGFGVTLALVIGQRMTTDAMAVVLGVAVGVAASVPTSLLLVALLRRRAGRGWRSRAAGRRRRRSQQPNVIVLNPADLLGQRREQPYVPQPPPELLRRMPACAACASSATTTSGTQVTGRRLRATWTMLEQGGHRCNNRHQGLRVILAPNGFYPQAFHWQGAHVARACLWSVCRRPAWSGDFACARPKALTIWGSTSARGSGRSTVARLAGPRPGAPVRGCRVTRCRRWRRRAHPAIEGAHRHCLPQPAKEGTMQTGLLWFDSDPNAGWQPRSRMPRGAIGRSSDGRRIPVM